MEPPGENHGLPATGLRLSKLSAALGRHCGHRVLHTGLRGLPLRNANRDVESVLVHRGRDAKQIETSEDAITYAASSPGTLFRSAKVASLAQQLVPAVRARGLGVDAGGGSEG